MFDEIQTAPTQPAPTIPAAAEPPPADTTTGTGAQAEAPQPADSGDPPADPPLPKGVQKRIDRLTRERYRLQAELDQVKQSQAKPATQTQQTAAAAPDGMPQRAQYRTDDEFFEAVVDWRAEHKIAERTRKEQQAAEETDRRRMQSEWDKRADDARDAYDDFDDVAMAPDVPVTPIMAQAIQRSEKGPDIAYYLGKNKAEAAKIARMDPFSQAMAIGRIEANVSRPAEKRATDAPAPINPVGQRGAAPTKDPEKMSTAEWVKWRNEQLAAQRKKR